MNNHILYRQYDDSENLLYIGISSSFLERLSQHKCDTAWFDKVYKIILQRFETKEKLLAAEKKAIKKEKPMFNVQHNTLHKLNIIKPKPIITLSKVAKLLNVNRRTLYRMIKDKRFPVNPIKGTKPRLWLAADVDDWLAGK